MQKTQHILIIAALALVGCEDNDDEVSFGGADTGPIDGGGSGDGGGDGGATDAEPYGPENSWYHVMDDQIPGDLAGTGYSQGDIAHNFTMVDQFGDDVELYQFYGQVIVLDVFAEW